MSTTFFFSLLLILSANHIAAADYYSTTLDSTIQYYAFKELSQAKTGILYQIPLPSNLSGIQASVIRLRRKSFFSKGENSSLFKIPPKTIPLPYVQRLVFVYQNLGNWSSYYYNAPGYSLASSVIGFLVYNASSTTSNELSFNATGENIRISFNLTEGVNASSTKCAKFVHDGSVQIGEVVAGSSCLATSSGHFSIVVPAEVRPPDTRGRRWWIWVVVGGFGVVICVVLIGVGILKLVRNKKRELMEGRSNEGVVLGSVWIGESKMPAADIVRTQPVIETDNAP